MGDDCADCQSKRKDIVSLTNQIGRLQKENSELEETRDELSREIADEQDAREEADKLREDAYDAKDAAVGALHEEKDRELAMLRRLEWVLHGLCPICHGVVQHKTGCDMKLAIFRLDHELHRSEYLHL